MRNASPKVSREELKVAISKYLNDAPADSISDKKVLLDRMLSRAMIISDGVEDPGVTVKWPLVLVYCKPNYQGDIQVGWADDANISLVNTSVVALHYQGEILGANAILDRHIFLECGALDDLRSLDQFFGYCGKDLLAKHAALKEEFASRLYGGKPRSGQEPIGLSTMIAKESNKGMVGRQRRCDNEWLRNQAAGGVKLEGLIPTMDQLDSQTTKREGEPTFYVCGKEMFDALRVASKSDVGDAMSFRPRDTLYHREVHWDPALDMMGWNKRLYAIDENAVQLYHRTDPKDQIWITMSSLAGGAQKIDIEYSWALLAKRLDSSYVMELE